MAADVNFISEGTPSLACMTVCTFYTPFLFAGFGMTAHALEQQIGEQCDSSGVDNLETLHPDSIPAFAAVRGKHMPVCGV